MNSTEKIRCPKCGELKDPKDFYYLKTGRKISDFCKKCYNKKQQERYRQKHPSAKRLLITYDKNDFHCRKCGKLKVPEDFYYNKGKKSGVCKDCDSERRKKIYHQKNPEADYRKKFDINDLHCSRCGELLKPEDFKYINGRRQGLCKACIRERWLELYHIKNPESAYSGCYPHKVETDFDYGQARHLIGKYKICPVCEQKKPLADFSKEIIMRLPLYYHYYRPTNFLIIREFYKECSDCRNRMYELHDHFVMHAY